MVDFSSYTGGSDGDDGMLILFWEECRGNMGG
jgi:hypothetical protein